MPYILNSKTSHRVREYICGKYNSQVLRPVITKVSYKQIRKRQINRTMTRHKRGNLNVFNHSLVISYRQIKALKRCHFTPIRLAEITSDKSTLPLILGIKETLGHY